MLSLPVSAADPHAFFDTVTPVLVLGLGNILLQDEGIGVRVVEQLQRDYHMPDDVEVLDGGTAGMALYEHIIDRQHLLVVDAVKTGRPPGTLVTLSGEQVPAFFRNKVSPHQLALSDILAALKISGTQLPELTVVGIEPLNLETGLDLSTAVTEKIPALIDEVVQQLTSLGFAPKLK
ncbi:HyaD/HybD family hydrogenase maturation endopeptidase [Kaarinaea lacus]